MEIELLKILTELSPMTVLVYIIIRQQVQIEKLVDLTIRIGNEQSRNLSLLSTAISGLPVGTVNNPESNSSHG